MMVATTQISSVCYCKSMFQVFGMLQVLYIDVAKVDRDVTHVVMTIHVCFKCMFQIFHRFQTYIVSVLSRCCKTRSGCCILQAYVSSVFRFSYICLQVFHLDTAYVCNVFSNVLRRFRKCFIRLFQVFHLYSFVCYNCCSWMFQK
jgi:hypothetical protein